MNFLARIFTPAILRTGALFTIGLCINCVFALVTMRAYVQLNVRLQNIEQQMRIIRVHTDQGTVLCSVDGMHWFDAREDSMCHIEDQHMARYLELEPARPTSDRRSTQ